MNKLVFYFINLENNILKEIILKIKLKTFLSIYLCKYNQRIKLFRNFIDNQLIFEKGVIEYNPYVKMFEKNKMLQKSKLFSFYFSSILNYLFLKRKKVV